MAASSSDGDLTQNLRDQFLQCKICLDGLKVPKTLPCLHTFCADCVAYYIDHNRLDSRKFSCPICRRHIYIPKNGVEGFPDSFFVETLNDVLSQSTAGGGGERGQAECGICRFKEGKVNATVLCVECKIALCGNCSEAHNDAKVTESHTLLPLSQQHGCLSREHYCRVHRGETVKYYCETCNSPICLPCTFLDHKGHEIEEIKNVRQGFMGEMEAKVTQAQDAILILGSARDDLVELENELFVRKEVVKTDIRRTMQELMRNIQDQEAQLSNEVDVCYDTVALGRDRQAVERTIFRLQRAHDFAQQLLATDTSPIAQIINRTEAKANLEQALEYELPDVTEHAAKLTRYVHYLPGKHDITLGSLLACTKESSKECVTTQLQRAGPSSRALFLHKFRTGDPTELEDVVALCFLPNGDIAVLVTNAKKVKIFSQKGKLRYEFGEDDDLLHPSDLVVTRDGEIAITDCGFLVVKIFDTFGTLRSTFGEDGLFALPISLDIDQLGRFMVCDQVKQQVTIHRQNGELLNRASISEVGVPQVLCCYDNKIYVCDSDNKTVTIYLFNDGSLNFVARLSASEENGEFLDCASICLDSSGGLLVADALQDRIHHLNGRGQLSFICPSGKSFLHPTCMASSSDGLLVVAQQGVTIDSDVPSMADVCLYRMVRADAC